MMCLKTVGISSHPTCQAYLFPVVVLAGGGTQGPLVGLLLRLLPLPDAEALRRKLLDPTLLAGFGSPNLV